MNVLRFDKDRQAVINPWDTTQRAEDFPELVLTCFPCNLVEYLRSAYPSQRVASLFNANGEIYVYELTVGERKVGLVMSLVGAPAAVSQYEELFAMGAERLVVFGTCGVLEPSIKDCAIILPDRAVRDEGTSFHYAPEGEEIAVNVGSLERMEAFFRQKKIPYGKGKCWTTDGIYRETREKVAARRAQGCLCVDMECASIAALAQFRKKEIAQFFYGADKLDEEEWDIRSLLNQERVEEKYRIAELALELALSL